MHVIESRYVRRAEHLLAGTARTASVMREPFVGLFFGLFAGFFLALLPSAGVQAQGFNILSGRNHPELQWQVAETPHFRIMYPARLAGIENEAAPIAEASYAALAANLETEFDRKIDIYLTDEDEITNGFAVPIGNGYTNIWVHVPDFARLKSGPEKWLRSVVAHELAHIFHYQKVLVRPRWLNYLFADPLPRFWTEGIAQYETEHWTAMRGDRWLRTAVLDDELSYRDGRSVWNGRLLYAIGNSQVRYLADRYGDSTLVDILEHRTPVLFGLAHVHDFGSALEDVTGDSYRGFYDDWRRHVNVYYNTAAGLLENADSLDAEPLELPGQYYYDISFSPDTSHVAVLALASLRRPVQRLIVMNRESGGVETVEEGTVYGPVAWSPDGRRLAYARLHRGAHGSLLRDVYVVDRDGSNRRQITKDRRAGSPAFSPDGDRLAFSEAERGTENIHILDLDSGDDIRATQFEGDVQISSIRWHPTADRLLFDRFTAEGVRDVAVLELGSGDITALTSGDQDDRDPVWSPDGERVAFVSFRDDVPNVFIADADTIERVTRLATGAQVYDWLPPDSANADGSLIVTSAVSKTNDRAFRIDAARRVPEPDVTIPQEYRRWTEHRPPVTIPAQIEPDSSLIGRRHAYRSLRNLRHATTLAVPYVRIGRDWSLGADWGIAALTAWIEPLGKHAIVAAGALSIPDPLEESYALASYINNQWFPTLSASLYRIPGSAQVYGSDLLVEAYTGGDLTIAWPLDWSDRPYTTETLDARFRLVDIEALNRESFEAPSSLPTPDEGQQADVRAGLTWQKQRPYWNNVIHPLDGLGARLQLTAAGRVLGADSEYLRADLAGYSVLQSIGLHRIYLYGRGQMQLGESFAQDFVGLSRHDAVQIYLPNQLPLFLGDTERVRGYRSYALGNRMLFGSAEYRVPLLSSLQTRLLGLLSFGSVAGALFADAGVVWSNGDFGEAIERVGVGVELKNALDLAGVFTISHALGAAQPTRDIGSGSDVEVYYRIRTTLPF